jgi:hypothetical protein
LALIALMGFAPALSVPTFASSHMDAPLITLDPAANTTDIYAFVSQDQDGKKFLTVAMSVYPMENPGIGPNKYNFDDYVRYDLHVALGKDVAAGRPTITYRFEFDTKFKNSKTLLQSYLGVVNDVVNSVGDPNQNLTQTYTVKKPLWPGDDARRRGRSAEQPGQRHAFLQRGRQRREPGAQRRREDGGFGQVYPEIDLHLPQRLHGVRRTARRRLLCRRAIYLRPAQTA